MSFTADPDQVDLLAEIEQVRTDLLSTIAHELRTPLTAVRTSVGLLLDPTLEPDHDERRTLLTTIDRNAMRMQRLVGDILDLARFRAGRVQLQLRRFDARELASAAIASVAPLAETQRQTITLAAPPEPVPVFGDRQRLEQALVNLLSNAGKYTPPDTAIEVTLHRAGAGADLCVTDHGPGIAPDEREKVFELFYRSDESARVTRGVGIGLSLTRQLVTHLKGTIAAEETPGGGARFRVTIPLADTSPDGESSGSEPTHPSVGS